MTAKEHLDALLTTASKAAKEKRWNEAFAAVEEALDSDPENLRALDLAGFICFFRKELEQAERYCRRALFIDPGHTYAKSGLGMCLARQGRTDEGIACLREAIDEKPEWSDPYWDLAIVLRDAGRIEDAISVIDLALEHNPTPKKAFLFFREKLTGTMCKPEV